MLKDKKSIRLFTVVVVVAILLGIYFSKKRIDYFYNFNPQKLTRIEIQSGNSGEVTIVDDEGNKEIVLDYLETLSFRRKISIPFFSGWRYRVIMYIGEGKVLDITFNGKSSCKIDGTNYSISSDTNEDIEELYQRLTLHNNPNNVKER